MLSRTEHIEGFHLKVSEVEKEIYEEFERSQEQELVALMQEHFAKAKREGKGLKIDNKEMWAEIEDKVDVWFNGMCTGLQQDGEAVERAKDAIRHRLRDHLIKAIRTFLTRKQRPDEP